MGVYVDVMPASHHLLAYHKAFCVLVSLLSGIMQSVCILYSQLGGEPIEKDVVPSLGYCHPSQLPATAAVSDSNCCRRC